MRKGKMRGGIDGCLRAARRAIGGPCSEPVVPAASAPRTQTAHLGESDGPAGRDFPEKLSMRKGKMSGGIEGCRCLRVAR
jgi:hypothetical protein